VAPGWGRGGGQRRQGGEAWRGGPLETGAEAAEALATFIEHYRDKPLPAEVAQAALGPQRVAEIEAAVDHLLDAEGTPDDKSVGGLAARWVQTERRRVQSGQVSRPCR
jgi:hypothetical protein